MRRVAWVVGGVHNRAAATAVGESRRVHGVWGPDGQGTADQTSQKKGEAGVLPHMHVPSPACVPPCHPSNTQHGGACRPLTLTHGHERVADGAGEAADVRQRLEHGVGQVVDERFVGVEGGHAAPMHDAALVRQLAVLHVNLLQRLNVLAHKADGHGQHRLDAAAAQHPKNWGAGWASGRAFRH